MGAWNQILAGLTGGFQGYGKQQDEDYQRQRQAVNDARAESDSAGQRALRQAQTDKANGDARQSAALRTPEFQTTYQKARGGDEAAIAQVASMVAGHPDAASYMNSLTKEPKTIYDATRGGTVDVGAKTFTPIAGMTPTPKAPVPGTPEWRQSKIDEAKIGAQYGYHPPEPVMTVASPTDPTVGVITPRSQAIGQNTPQKPRSETAMNVAADARLKAAVSEMNNAHAGMADYEDRLSRGTANINGLQQFAGRVANSFTHDDPISMAAQSAALTALNNTNPDLARYVRRGLSFAEGESMISQRPSDFRTKMAAFLSQAASGAAPEMIHDIQQRRNSILTPLNSTVGPVQPSRAGGPPSPNSGDVNLGTPQRRSTDVKPPSPLRVKYDAAAAHLKARGKTDADVIAAIGHAPDEE